MKLSESIPSTNVKIIELYNKIDSTVLNMSPDFQRKLVWKKQHKFHFIETILKNYPFPEVYIASSDIDVSSIKATEIVVDGQQRLSTIVDYIKGDGDFQSQRYVSSFNSLESTDKKDFLNYLVSVRDLKDMDLSRIKEIFMRINNTEYSLNTVEKTNAQYGDGEFIIFCKQLTEEDYVPDENMTDSIIDLDTKKIINDFFMTKSIFTDNDRKRMIRLQFIMTLVSTLIESNYFGRNAKSIVYIKKYNEEFPIKEAIEEALLSCINFIEKLNFNASSYWYSKSNIFTLIIELSMYHISSIDPVKLKNELNIMEEESRKYFSGIDDESVTSDRKKYFELAKEAVNEKNSRVYRGSIIKKLFEVCKI